MAGLNDKVKSMYSSLYVNLSRKSRNRAYQNLYKSIISKNPTLHLESKAIGEDEWLKKWQSVDGAVSPIAYRIFSRYVGQDMTIAPLELINNIVEPVLNPENFSEFYSDKNTECLFIPSGFAPKTFIRNINGHIFSGDITRDLNQMIANIDADKIILKPSRQSSGCGIKIFYRDAGGFRDKNGVQLTSRYLDEEYRRDYLIQECLVQSTSMSVFNPSSVNTIRMATYRDEYGVVHPLKSIIRIGGAGSEVDNAHAGGRFCGVMDDGTLGRYVCDTFGRMSTTFNGIDFENNEYRIPNFDKVKAFAIEVANNILHHDLVAFDIALDTNDNPLLIEYNIFGFGAWLFQFTSGGAFGDYTDEIFSRCLKNKDRVIANTYLCIK